MGREHTVFRREKGLSARIRLRGNNVHACREQLARTQSSGNSRLVKQPAAGRVEQDRPILHEGKSALTDEYPGCRH